MSDSQSSSKKRTASVASMDPPDEESPTKKQKRPTELERRLNKLKQTVTSLLPEWKNFDPDVFMAEMSLLRDQINGLTVKTVEEFITGSRLKEILNSLIDQEEDLKKPLTSLNSQLLDDAKLARKLMTDYVIEVRDCLNALVDQAQGKPSLNEFADSEEWRVYQQRSVGELWQSTLSDSQSTSKKRSASVASMDSPDKDSTTKKQKLPTELEMRLNELKQTVTDLRPEWKYYDPDVFMANMSYLRDQISKLTVNEVDGFITKTGLANALFALDVQEEALKKPLPLDTDPQLLDRTKLARKLMTDYVIEVRDCLNALVEQARGKPPPIEFADSEEWRRYQERSDAILCLRPADKRGLPISLMNAAFCRFTRHFHDPPLDEHTRKYLSMADKLCQTMPSAFDSEDDRRDAFENIFVSIDEELKPHTEFSLSAKVSIAKTISYDGSHLALLLEEFKLEPTEDVYMQISRSYEVLCGDPKNQRLLKFGNPMFLLCILGPYLMVCGAIKRENNVHVEPLTPFLPMFPGLGIKGHQVQIAYCLQALKHGLDALREFWQVLGILKGTNTTDKLPEPYLVLDCPDNSLLRFGDWQGTFESPIRDEYRPSTDKPLNFKAKLYKAGNECQRQVVVKFVYNYSGSGTYGTDVHEYLYGLGLAPMLYSAENLHHGLVMVVMECLPFAEGVGGWVELDTFEGKLGNRTKVVRQKLEKIIEHLQEHRMVHVDMRSRNIMIKVDEKGDIMIHENEPILSVIDFDWAGKVGEACYPPFLNPSVPWPPGTKAYQKVGENHDKILLEKWWYAFVKG